jgi:hypothetical protein
MGLSLENDTTGEKSLKKTSNQLKLAETFLTRKKDEERGRGGGGNN